MIIFNNFIFIHISVQINPFFILSKYINENLIELVNIGLNEAV